jgi:hypothetical protein
MIDAKIRRWTTDGLFSNTDKEGRWVLFEDVEKLQKRVEELEKAVEMALDNELETPVRNILRGALNDSSSEEKPK